MAREQQPQTPMMSPPPVMMSSPHMTSTVLRDAKKLRPEEEYVGVYTMSNQSQHNTLQQPHTPIDYK